MAGPSSGEDPEFEALQANTLEESLPQMVGLVPSVFFSSGSVCGRPLVRCLRLIVSSQKGFLVYNDNGFVASRVFSSRPWSSSWQSVAWAVGLPAAGLSLSASSKRGRIARCTETMATRGAAAGSETLPIHSMFSFCGQSDRYTPVFEAHPKANTASVNAGDYNLYVGGGAINKAFACVLRLNQPNEYQRLHSLLLEDALRKPGNLIAGGKPAQEVANNLGCVASFVRIPAGLGRGPVGAVFIDVFADEARPLNKRNVAMIYVVGPKGRGAPGGHGPTISDCEEFLKAVTDLGANAIAAVQEYNQQSQERQLPCIDIVQWCLVSGGVYRHPQSSKLDVAKATVEGLSRIALSADCHPPQIKFTYDEGVFEEAVRLATQKQCPGTVAATASPVA